MDIRPLVLKDTYPKWAPHNIGRFYKLACDEIWPIVL